jgi:hypothetical protein
MWMRIFIVLAVIFHCGPKIKAQVSFTATDYALPYFPYSIATGDYNGDGLKDLVADISFSVSVLLGTTTGSFATNIDVNLGFTPNCFNHTDVNYDGNDDLIIGRNGKVSILYGSSNGTLSTVATYTITHLTSAVEISDVNNDGIDDIIVGGDSASVLLSNGAGGFLSPITFSASQKPVDVVCFDFNKDGKKDLATANYTTNSISVAMGNGTGNFGSPITFSAGPFPDQLLTNDFTNDSKADLAVGNGKSITIFKGDDLGNFVKINEVSTYGVLRNMGSADFNGDGTADLVYTHYDTLAVILGTGYGGFTTPFNFTTDGDPFMSIVCGDFNNDKMIDVAAAMDYKVKVLINTSPPLAIENNGQLQKSLFYVLPNPSSGIVLVRLSPDIKEAKGYLLNSIGETLIEKNCSDYTEFNFKEQPSGIYFLRINSDNGVKTFKLVKD